MNVAIVGGGFAGLFAAHALRRQGIDDVVVLERSDRPGGVARAVTRDGYILEPAVGSFTLPHPHLSSLLGDTPLLPAATTARTRHVWTGRRLVTLQPGPRTILAPIVPIGAKLRALAEPLVPAVDGDVTLDAFLRHRLGDGLGHTAAWLAASGVFAGDPANLSARAAFPAMTGLVASEGTLLVGGIRRMRQRPPDAPPPSIHVPSTTMSDVATAIADDLGDRFRPGHEVEHLRREGSRWIIEGRERFVADEVIVTCHPTAAAPLLGGPLADLLGQAVSAPTVVIGFGGVGRTRDGFGVLTGPRARTATRGILLESSYAPHRAPPGHFLLKVIAGGDPPSPLLESDDAGLIENVGTEVARILGHDLEASFVEVVRHAPGIPQYRTGHERWVAAVEQDTPAGLHLAGWGYRGVGVSHLATDAVRLAARIGR